MNLDDLKRDCFDKTYFNGGDPSEFMDYVDRIIDHLTTPERIK